MTPPQADDPATRRSHLTPSASPWERVVAGRRRPRNSPPAAPTFPPKRSSGRCCLKRLRRGADSARSHQPSPVCRRCTHSRKPQGLSAGTGVALTPATIHTVPRCGPCYALTMTKRLNCSLHPRGWRATDEARRALVLVTEFTYQARPKIPEQTSRSRTGNPLPRQRRRTRREHALSPEVRPALG